MNFLVLFMAGGTRPADWPKQCGAAAKAIIEAVGVTPTPIMSSPSLDTMVVSFSAEASADAVYSAITARLHAQNRSALTSEMPAQKLLVFEIAGAIAASDEIWKVAFKLSRR